MSQRLPIIPTNFTGVWPISPIFATYPIIHPNYEDHLYWTQLRGTRQGAE